MDQRKPLSPIIAAVACGGLAMVCTGCYFGQEKYERSEVLEATLESGGRFAAETHNGAITVAGGDEEVCRVTAKITGYAPDIEQAQRLAELVRVRLVARSGGLGTVVDKPNLPNRCGLSVEFDVSVPRRTGLDLLTHNGAVRVSDIEANLRARTHNGEVRAQRVVGKVDLETHNGRVQAEDVTGEAVLETYNGAIVCRQFVGPLNATTHNGDVTVVYGEAAPAAVNGRVVTYNGSVDVAAPPKLSAKVRIQTHNGSVKTAVPITVEGEIDKNRILGTAGQGEGTVHLETHNGSITLR